MISVFDILSGRAEGRYILVVLLNGRLWRCKDTATIYCDANAIGYFHLECVCGLVDIFDCAIDATGCDDLLSAGNVVAEVLYLDRRAHV